MTYAKKAFAFQMAATSVRLQNTFEASNQLAEFPFLDLRSEGNGAKPEQSGESNAGGHQPQHRCESRPWKLGMRGFCGVPSDVSFDGQRQTTDVVLDRPPGGEAEICDVQREYD